MPDLPKTPLVCRLTSVRVEKLEPLVQGYLPRQDLTSPEIHFPAPEVPSPQPNVRNPKNDISLSLNNGDLWGGSALLVLVCTYHPSVRPSIHPFHNLKAPTMWQARG